MSVVMRRAGVGEDIALQEPRSPDAAIRPCGVGRILLLAPYIIKVVYGDYFENIIYIMRMLAFLPLLSSLSNAYISDGLIVAGKDRLVFVLQTLSAVVNIVLLLVFLPVFGLKAALIIKIIVDAVTLLAGMVLYYNVLRRHQV